MKLPFSYRQTFFNTTLGISVAGHLVLFASAASPWFSASPQFAVRRAPESMEVRILDVRREESPKIPREILTLRDPLASDVPAAKIQKKLEPQKSQRKKMLVPENRGAQMEPRLSAFENPAPVYPEYAREQGWEGAVTLKVYVTRAGRAEDVRVEHSSGYDILDQAALRTVREWRFQPARFGRTNFSSWIRIPIRFVLKD